jgi:hypothetical protein
MANDISYSGTRRRAERIVIVVGLVLVFVVAALATVIIHPSLAGIAPG